MNYITFYNLNTERIGIFTINIIIFVRETRLERATSWSQTTGSTNWTTPVKTILYSRIAVNFARTLSFFLQIVSSASFSVWAALISSSLAAIPSFAWVLTALSPSIAVLKAFKTLSTFFDRSVDVVPFWIKHV